MKFLQISQVWSQAERQAFKERIQHFPGRARVAFCDLTGLNDAFLNRASREELWIAFNNVGGQFNIDLQLEDDQLRDWLTAFCNNTIN